MAYTWCLLKTVNMNANTEVLLMFISEFVCYSLSIHEKEWYKRGRKHSSVSTFTHILLYFPNNTGFMTSCALTPSYLAMRRTRFQTRCHYVFASGCLHVSGSCLFTVSLFLCSLGRIKYLKTQLTRVMLLKLGWDVRVWRDCVSQRETERLSYSSRPQREMRSSVTSFSAEPSRILSLPLDVMCVYMQGKKLKEEENTNSWRRREEK